jgi:acetate kinase
VKVAVVNCGSSSIKYEVFRAADSVLLASGLVEKIGAADGHLRQRRRNADGTFDEHSYTRALSDHGDGFKLIEWANRKHGIIGRESELLGIGHRVVHGGDVFSGPRMIDDEVIAAIRDLIPLAPLHNPANLLGIETARDRFPHVPQVAVFDTAFHHTLPPHASHYAVPYELYAEHHVRRYGFHGTSHCYVAKEAAGYLGRPLSELNLITLHLGNGASAAAIRGGLSVDTSMGLTPLEGLIMGTRCGDIDPAVHFYLMRQTGMTPDELEKVLESDSGLKGICGSNDMREIEDQAARGNERAGLAIDMFCYRIKKYVGAYRAVLGRLEAVVFTGGIGENSPLVRERVCGGLEHLGIALDAGRNTGAEGKVAEIQTEGSALRVLVIKTDEEREIAGQTVGVIEKAGASSPGVR